MIGGSTAAAELAALKPWPNPAPAIARDERLARVAKAQALMSTDAMIVGAGASLRYFAGLAGTPPSGWSRWSCPRWAGR